MPGIAHTRVASIAAEAAAISGEPPLQVLKSIGSRAILSASQRGDRSKLVTVISPFAWRVKAYAALPPNVFCQNSP